MGVLKTANTDLIASKFLGKKVAGSLNYAPELLVAVPRCENRRHYGIDENNLPFAGFDVWHAYEFSCLTENGLPVTRLLKLKYNCTSPFIIESKSLKLYLNSFNMTKYGKNTADCLAICKKIIENDLSQKLETDVTVYFIPNNEKKVEIFQNFTNIARFFDENELKIENFKENPQVLETETTNITTEHYLTFDSLRSNCRVTHQPDFGDVFIYYTSQKHIKEISLVKYLCSFRSEYHFHEECCEMIFKRLLDLLKEGDELFVCALYTRRGGIDICPVRYNCKIKVADALLDITQLARYGVKQ